MSSASGNCDVQAGRLAAALAATVADWGRASGGASWRDGCARLRDIDLDLNFDLTGVRAVIPGLVAAAEAVAAEAAECGPESAALGVARLFRNVANR